MFKSAKMKASLSLLLIGVMSIPLMSGANAESLFRASASFRENMPYTPPSLFTPPTPRNVGDMVTILIDETSSLSSSAELKITRAQTVDSNGSGMFNSMVRFFADKIPVVGKSIVKVVESPNFDGLDSSNGFNSKGESSRNTALKDTITCQVVQILPNGFLVVQGRKVAGINRDQQEFFVTGIVNPYYLNRMNQIASAQVGNFQLLQGGKGVISRTQSDGIANKIYQFFN